MKAVYINKFGSIENLEFREVEKPPSPSGTQILVSVKAAGLNRADLLQVRGSYPPPTGYSRNMPGLEFAGEIMATGDAATSWRAGDRVFGITAGEGQAEFLLIDATLLSRIPENLSFLDAAAVPEAFITAHDAIITRGLLATGESLLIHAVGSGVGLAALQLAKERGVFVIGTSRTNDKLERCREFGLDAGIATQAEPEFVGKIAEITSGKGVGVILDLVGAAYLEQNLNSMAVKGRLVLVGLTSGRTAEFNLGLALQKRLTIVGTSLRGRSTPEKAEAVRRFNNEVIPLLTTGKVRPNIDRTFAAADVVTAYKYLDSNKSFGKVVLEF